jgi:hypothetical protein
LYHTPRPEPWFDGLRGDPRFTVILKEAETRSREAAAAFAQAGGDRLLGLTR